MKEKELIWMLSDEDFKEIGDLFEKKLALENLLRMDGIEKRTVYDRAVEDLGNTVRLFNEWWITKSQKYQWKGNSWSVDFARQGIVCNDDEDSVEK